MDPRQQQQLKQYLNIVLRWKKTIIACLLVSIAAGLGLYVKTPKTYQASAVVVYQSQKINPAKMSPDLKEKTEEIIATLSEQVLSRTNLEDIIKKYGLYQNLLQKLPMEDVIDIMRNKHIQIKPDTKGDTFRVSYQGATPRKVMLVTNALASKFVEENLRYREERATETTAYVKDELAMAEKSLEEIEAAMRDYKLKYYNEMPEQRQINMTRLNALQNSYQNIQTSMQELERTKIMVQEQLTLRKNLLRQAMDSDILMQPQDETAARHSQTLRELNRLRAELTGLLARYTDEHPEVKRTRKTIAGLEAKLKSMAPSTGENSNGEQQGTLPVADKQIPQLELQLRDISISMAQLKKEAAEIKKQIEIYQKWIAAAPVREAEWANLTRDYQQLNKHYQDLVTKSLEAESAESLEKKQKGSQFRVIDPARLPEKPFKPDFIRIMAVALALGLGVGGGIAFTLEYLDTSFKEAHDLESYLQLPVVCSVPLVNTIREKRQARIKGVFWTLCFLAVLAGLLTTMLLLWRRGIIVF